jgi:hypothetical protein
MRLRWCIPGLLEAGADSGGSEDITNFKKSMSLYKLLSPGKALPLIPGWLKMKTKGTLLKFQNAPHLQNA